MSTAQCFRCHNTYQSEHPDDLAGDGKCSTCKELSKQIAFKVDMEMAERRKHLTPSNLEQLGVSAEGFDVDPLGRIVKGSTTRNINAKEIGLNNWGS
jgi:hypothetical protein